MSYHLTFAPRPPRTDPLDLVRVREAFGEQEGYLREETENQYCTFVFGHRETGELHIHWVEAGELWASVTSEEHVPTLVRLGDAIGSDLFGEEGERYLADGSYIAAASARDQRGVRAPLIELWRRVSFVVMMLAAGLVLRAIVAGLDGL